MIEVIPAIDLIDGRCVRLSQGDYSRKTVYGDSPCDMVKMFCDAGLTRIHVVDLDGAKASGPANLPVLEQMVAKCPQARIEWGGGIKKTEYLRQVLDAGAAYAIIGSVAVKDPELFIGWLKTFGHNKIILGADVRNNNIAINGWLDNSDQTIPSLIEKFTSQGLTQAIVTDISCDGMLKGPNFKLYTALQEQFPQVTFTVSGGVATIDDIIEAYSLGLKRIIVGKALYEGRITIKQLTGL